MNVSDSLMDQVASAQAQATVLEHQISAISPASEDGETLRGATLALERLAVDIFSLFEARMQHHFKRGPFSRKLVALLSTSGEAELAEKLRQYYLAVNVLKHGKGESHRALLAEANPIVVLRPAQDAGPEEVSHPVGLVDVTKAGFFSGLTTTILEAQQFLENRAEA